MKYAAIADWAAQDLFDVDFMCTQLGVSRSGYYAWRTRALSARARADASLTSLMVRLFESARGNPGVRRMAAMLAAAGHQVSRRRTHRLMRAAPAPDLIGRDFTAPAPNTRWVGDITYVKTWDGWAYLATVIDLHSRAVVGWALAEHMHTSLVTNALTMAITARSATAHLLDRGGVATTG